MDRSRIRNALGAVLLVSLSLSGCTPAPSDLGGRDDITAPTSAAPPPAPIPPAGFDLSHSVTLEANGWRGVLDGLDYYLLDHNANIVGIDVAEGKTKFHTSLTGQDSGEERWICPSHAVDEHNVYTVATNSSETYMPTRVVLTAVSKQTGQVLWRFWHESTLLSYPAECYMVVDYDITPTPAGVVLSMWQWDESANDVEYTSVLLDPASGDTLWSADEFVFAAPGSNIAFMQDTGLTVVDLSSFNKHTALNTPPLPKNTETGYYLAGQIGDNILVLRQDMSMDEYMDDGPPEATTTVFLIDAGTGSLAPGEPVTLESQDYFYGCQTTAEALVCRGTIDPLSVSGVSLQDGSTLWQRNHSVEDWGLQPPDPVLFAGYLYGHTEDSSFVLDTSTGNTVSTGDWPQPLAVNEAGMVYEVIDYEADEQELTWVPAK